MMRTERKGNGRCGASSPRPSVILSGQELDVARRLRSATVGDALKHLPYSNKQDDFPCPARSPANLRNTRMPGRPSRRSPAFLPWKGESHSADRPHFMNLRDVLRRVAGSAAFGFRHGRRAEQNASHVEDMTFCRVVPNGLPFGVALFRVTTVAGGGTVKLSTG